MYSRGRRSGVGGFLLLKSDGVGIEVDGEDTLEIFFFDVLIFLNSGEAGEGEEFRECVSRWWFGGWEGI